MPTQFTSARHQAMLSVPTGYRRFSRFTFSRNGVTRTLEPVSGSITQDARRNARWDARLSFTGDDIIPERPGDLLTPFGTRVVAELGLELLDGSLSTVPYGVFMIGSAKTRTEAGTRMVDVGLIDMSDRVDRYRFERPYKIANGVDLATMVNTVIANRTGLNPGLGATGQALSGDHVFGLETGTSPWEELLDVLRGYNRTGWYDRTGQVQVATVVPNLNAAYPLNDQLVSMSVDFDTRPPNVMVVRGEKPDGSTPILAVTLDSDPSSPTYAGATAGASPYGRVTDYYAWGASSNAWALFPGLPALIGQTLLANRAGAGASYTMTMPYDPTITAGDVVTRDGRTFSADAITINLAGETTVQARELS